MDPGTIALFVVGGALLIGGAELLVRSASRLAVAAGIAPLVVGLTVVAFGTSSPELAVTVGSAYTGEVDMALGNVLGSNIFNVLFILGLSALITPLVVANQLVRLDVPIMIGVSVLTLLLALDGRLGWEDGLVLVIGLLAYTGFLIWQSRREQGDAPSEAGASVEAAGAGASIPRDAVLIVVGLGLLVLGARWFVRGAVTTATALGVDEMVVGLTIVAAGTSLPEVATSVLAALRGERDIAVGNVVGSNIFNLLGVLGLGSLAAPGGLPVSTGALTFDIPVMGAVAVATLPIFFTGLTISRWEGAVFLAYYVAYTAYLVMHATGHAALSAFSAAMVWFALPLTALTLAISVLRAARQRGRGSSAPGSDQSRTHPDS